MFEKNGSPIKRVKKCTNRPKGTFLHIKHTFQHICARCTPPQLGVVLVFFLIFSRKRHQYKTAWVKTISLFFSKNESLLVHYDMPLKCWNECDSDGAAKKKWVKYTILASGSLINLSHINTKLSNDGYNFFEIAC